MDRENYSMGGGQGWKRREKLKGQNSLVRKTVVIEIRRNENLHLRNIKGLKGRLANIPTFHRHWLRSLN